MTRRCWAGAGFGRPRFAWDSYRRFIQMYSDVVLGVDHHLFEDALEIVKEDNGFYADVELEAEHWQALVGEYKAIVEKALGARSRRMCMNSSGARSARCSTAGKANAPRSIAV
jgi:hypothetical protein